jgi:peptidylprolyl isomerase domain and WD repeat-containing protein 1
MMRIILPRKKKENVSYVINSDLVFEEKENKKYNLDNLPFANFYEKSYMHKDVIDNVVCAVETDFIITTSLDGNLKFWKKNYIGIEFVKQYKAHQGKITGISVSNSGLYLSTCSSKDESLKIFDVLNFDMIHFIKLKFVPYHCEIVSKINDPCLLIALSEKDKGNIYLVKAESKGEIYKTVKLHDHPVTSIKFNENYNSVISVDSSGMIEYWDVETLGKI